MTLTVAYLDIDNFKQVNDRLSHAGGDELLKMTAHFLSENIRQTDLAARLGGDEFVVVFPGIGRDEASEILQRAQSKIMAYYREKQTGTSPVSINEMIRAADRAMYEAKSQGKDQIFTAGIADHSAEVL